MMETITFKACHACAVFLANADDSHLDPEDAEMVHATVAAIYRDEPVGGPLAVQGEPISDSYCDCYFCDAITVDAYPVIAFLDR